tara:strand:- start:5237 stop:7477 length:2241 start_codon:yes stop_codon:yes gene_type:complete
MKELALWFFMVLFCSAHAQRISLSDAISGEAISTAKISFADTSVVIFTDAEGQADLSTWQNLDSLCISATGYRTLCIPYDVVQKMNFAVNLVRSDVLLDEIVVTSYQEESTRQTSIHIEPLNLREINQRGSFNLNEALTAVTGVNQFSTGIGISKPVIRGLSGNRVQVLLSGLRFNDQQWQDEHGLGISALGISKVEIIKGPMSILYGTEAMGGLINIVEEKAPPAGTFQNDYSAQFHSNTLGGVLQAGTKANYGDHWYRLRLSLSSHSDYSDGQNERVLNSRFQAYQLKSSYGFTKENWQSTEHYQLSYSRSGFIFNDFSHFMSADPRWSRSMTGPYHAVLLNRFSSVNEIKLSDSRLKLNAGFQSNLRSENEGGGELSLVMHLLSLQYALKWHKALKNNWSLVLSNTSNLQSNSNYGKRKIVPDAWLAESSVSAYLKKKLPKIVLEYGLGAGVKHIKTLSTNTVNTAEKEIEPFKQTRPFYNALLGMSYNPAKKWNLKLNLSTGVRSPNLAELSANGLHEGIYVYEIGNPTLKNEQNINADLGLNYFGKQFQFGLSAYYNYFYRYLYLLPSKEEWFGFPVSRFTQMDALIKGLEAELVYHPEILNGLKVSVNYTGLIGQLRNGDFLPFMPAQSIKPELRYEGPEKSKFLSYYFVNSNFVLSQKLVSPSESTSPSYQLVNAGFGFSRRTKKAYYSLNISANNLLNTAYYSHLSRLKNFDLLNIGRDISINLKIRFNHKIKNNNVQ